MTLKNKMKAVLLLFLTVVSFHSCNYSFKDVSIPPEVKTIKINYLDNKARYVNPQLSPQLTDRLRQKINNQTRLTQIQGDDAHYEIRGNVSDYSISTAGVANSQSSINRLHVAVHIVLINRIDEKKGFEADVSRDFDFNANQSLQQAEAALSEQIIRNLTDEIFNRLFSNW